MTFRRPALAALACAALALPAAAQHLKPGLWEMNNSVVDSKGQMGAAMAMAQQQLAQMAPEQRKMVEDMMASHGVQLASAGGGGIAVRMCLTPEMVRNDEVPLHQQGNCTTQRLPAGSGQMKMSFSCTDPQASGTVDVVFHGDSHYTVKTHVIQNGNKNDAMDVESTARWLGADCGTVKPLSAK